MAAACEPPAPGWRARLQLGFESRAGVTRLVRNQHEGPLRLIRALPLSQGRCQAVIVHPPGGLVGGDRLEIDIDLAADAQVLCTTPGAQKWYRAHHAGARAHTRIACGPRAAIEWLPQATIVYDEARVDQGLQIDLDPEARMIGWECIVLGRAAMKEQFLRGALRQTIELRRGDQLLWSERTVAQAGDRLFESALGWGGRTVACTVWAASASGASLDDSVARWRSLLWQACDAAQARDLRLVGAASAVDAGLLVARLLADDSQLVMQTAQSLWSAARPTVIGAGEDLPRIWAT